MHLSTHKWVEDAIRLRHYCRPTMSLSRRRRGKQEQRRHHETRPATTDGVHECGGAWISPERLFAQRALEEPLGVPPQEPIPADEDELAEAVSLPRLREADEVERLAYTRRQAAEALGLSLATIDRRVVPAIETVKTPWGQRLIPVDELEPLPAHPP